LKCKISNYEDIADSYFEKVLTELESCYQLIMVNVIEVPEENPEIQTLKDMIDEIPKFPADFLDNWSSVKENADKVANVPNVLPATLSSANWTSTYTAGTKIPTAFSTSTLNTMLVNSNKVPSCGTGLPTTLTSGNWTAVLNRVNTIPTTFTADLVAITANSEKVAAVPDALPNTLSSANWTKIYNTVLSIPTDFFTDWNKMSYITKQELTDVLGISLGKIGDLEKILNDLDIK
jgi:hypothetical protein